MARYELHGPPYRAVQRLVVWAATQWGPLEREVFDRTGRGDLAGLSLRFAVSWLYQRMVESAPGGQPDVDAFLAGDPLPSAEAEVERKAGDLLAMGGEVVG